jgi:hypothetical protein
METRRERREIITLSNRLMGIRRSWPKLNRSTRLLVEFSMCLRMQARGRAECPRNSDRGAQTPHDRGFKQAKACSSKRSFHDHDEKMRTHDLQLYGCARKGTLQRYMCRCEENTRTYLPMQAPGVQRRRPQDVAWVWPLTQLRVSNSCPMFNPFQL